MSSTFFLVDPGASRPDILENLPLDRLHSRLSDAWSIWTSDGPPVEVVLHFSAEVAGRVSATLWHQSQKIEPQADGSTFWRAAIAEPREMYPWIRGWGPDVEVVAPEWLRDMHKEDFARGMRLYEQHENGKNETDV